MPMEYKLLSKCPVCDSRLIVTRLKCPECSTVIENNFKLSRFEALRAEQLNFIEVFLKCRGNIKDVEKEMGISYPTVRAKLDDVIESMGFNSPRKNLPNSKEILDLLEGDEISVEEAVDMLKK